MEDYQSHQHQHQHPHLADAGNNNNSLLISSLKDLDMELNQRNAAALQELNKEIDELSEIPLDSSQLPRFKDGIEFTSSSTQANATPSSTTQDQQRASATLRANDAKLFEKELANGFDSLQGKIHDMDLNLASDKTKEELDRKLKNILDMSKPYQAESSTEAKGAATPMTPFEPMDFGTDSIAAKLVNDSFKLPIDQPTPQTALEMNLEDVTRRLQSYRVPLKESNDSNNYPRAVVAEQLPKIPVPSSFDILSMANDAAPPRFSQTKPGPQPPSIQTNYAPPSQNSQEQSLDDSRAIIAALRTLQDRVGKLETEKSAAKQKISSLENELTTTRTLLLHQQQLNLRSLAHDAEGHLPATNVTAPVPSAPSSSSRTAQQSEYRVSLPIPDRASDHTLRHISEAREKVGNVQEELARLEKLGQSGSLSSAAVPKDSLYTLPQSQQHASSVDHEKSLDDPALLFDEILKKHSIQLIRESQTPKSPAPASSSALPVKAWEAQAHPAPFKSKKVAAAEKFASQPAQTEIKKLQDSIIAERDLRKGELSYDPQVIKDKVLEKIKSSISSSKPLEKKSKSDAPIWKKSESRRSRSVTKESSLSSSAHVRKRAPIELPMVSKVASDETSGREMPFIVGRNTGKSFSVTANLQTVFSLLKSHNPEMCSVCSKRHPPDQKHPHKESFHGDNGKAVHVLDHYGGIDGGKRSPVKTAAAATAKAKSYGSIPTASTGGATAAPLSNITNQDLKDAADGVNNDSLFQILGVIEDEYRQAKAKYTHLVKQYEAVSTSMTTQVISDSTGTSTLKAIGEDLRHVIQAMEAKSDQIAILRDIITSSKSLTLKKEKQRKKTASASAPKRYTMDTATSRSRVRETSAGPSQKSSAAHRRARSQSPGRALASLSLLKSTLKVQNALGEPK